MQNKASKAKSSSSFAGTLYKFRFPLFSILGAALLTLAWPPLPTALLVFGAFVPLLFVERGLEAGQGKKWAGWQFFGWCYLHMVLWNTLTTWWVGYASVAGIVAAIVANSLLMVLPWVFMRLTKHYINPLTGYFTLPLYWVAFEYAHLNWQLSWPWLNLGNVFAVFPEWVQWYNVTGALGGTAWVLLVNLVIFFALVNKGHSRLAKARVAVALILVPIAISYLQYFLYEEKGDKVEVLVVQPNIDPYSEKFIGSEDYLPIEKQVDRLLKISEEHLQPETELVLWPETALDAGIEEERFGKEKLSKKLYNFTKRHPDVGLLGGFTGYKIYHTKKRPSPTARQAKSGKFFYDVYNAAFFLQGGKKARFYHKAKLVPGVESFPYPAVTGVLQEAVFDLGGTSGSLGRGEKRQVFPLTDTLGFGPVICYESIFGEFVGKFVKNGAQLITIITNDGWWKDTPGLRQHLHYARLRAVEHRRSIARAANTGISGFINQYGELEKTTTPWVQTAQRHQISANAEKTFYSQYGDILGRWCLFIAPLMMLSAWVRHKTHRLYLFKQ